MAPAGLLGRETECAALDELIRDARAGRSRTLVIRGEAGIGKSALLQHLVDTASGFTILRAVGVESEMELPFAGLHQLCGPLLDRVSALPEPQQRALETVFGVRDGPPPDRFLVGVAVLGLLNDAAQRGPVACVVDDLQWLDRASAQTLTFVARRLMADPVAVVFSTRAPVGEASGMPELVVGGLRDADARDLLTSMPGAPLDAQVRERIVRETSGNPLALLEWRRAATPAEFTGPFSSTHLPLTGRIEQVFRRQLAQLPTATQRFLLVAAAETVGDPLVIRRAAQRLGVHRDDGLPAVESGLLTLDTELLFRHPLVRSAAYNSASPEERMSVHRALAEVIDPEADPDRRAWHRAHAAALPDEDVATDLERSANRAQARGGLVAAAAFLERATQLSVDPARRAARALRAAAAQHQAGAPDAALRLLDTAERGPLDEFGLAQADLLRAQIAHTQNRLRDAPHLLLQAARRLEPLDVASARDAHVHALWAAQFAGRLARDGQLLEVARAVLAAPQLTQPRAVDLLLDGSAITLVHGYAAGVPMLRDAVRRFCSEETSRDDALRWCTFAAVVALFIWDFDSAERLSRRPVELGRETGAVAVLGAALGLRMTIAAIGGDLAAATRQLEEARTFAEAIGTELQPYGPLILAGWRGREQDVADLAAATLDEADARGEDEAVAATQHARAVLYNGSGRYDAALEAAVGSVPPRADGQLISNMALVELIEAAVRMGQIEQAEEALASLAVMTTSSGTDWALGVEARSRALLEVGPSAEELYRVAIERLGRTRMRGELARAHLVYGEWLRRENRRLAAREALRTAHEMFQSMGAERFAERTRRELAATGETVRARPAAAPAGLTAQEAQIARLAAEGRTNAEIGAELYISPRTVEWHLRAVFTKVGVTSRRQLRDVGAVVGPPPG